MSLQQPTARKGYSFGAFYDLMVQKFPEHRTVQNVLDVPRVCSDLNVTLETVYKMLRGDLIHPKQAAKLIAVHAIEARRLLKSETDQERRREGGCPVVAMTKLDLIEFVIPDPD